MRWTALCLIVVILSPPCRAAEEYKVMKGDTLRGIAAKSLGASDQWKQIFEANRDQLKSADSLLVGQTLNIPGVEAQTTKPAPSPLPAGELPVSTFREIWGYLMEGEEARLDSGAAFTDLAYFSATPGPDGRLKGPTEPPALKNFPGKLRWHLVVSLPWNTFLMSLYLRHDMPLRAGLIEDIAARSEHFDGIQIDFESIRKEDAKAFHDFLRVLRHNLPVGKMLSVAAMSRTADTTDAFHYPTLATLADRVIVMAYDEHHRSGDAGPIASLAWCKRVADYSAASIPRKKLIMGLPLYGRAWQGKSYARAYRHDDIYKMIKPDTAGITRTEGGVPHFSYSRTVDVTVYFEDVQSLSAKLSTYQDKGISAVALWRIGQEDKRIWPLLKQN